MSAPKDRAHHPKRKVDPREDAPEGWYDLTPEQMDEMDREAEKAHQGMSGEVNLLDKNTYGKPPF